MTYIRVKGEEKTVWNSLFLSFSLSLFPSLLTFLALAPLYDITLFCFDDDKPRLASCMAQYFYGVVPTPTRQ